MKILCLIFAVLLLLSFYTALQGQPPVNVKLLAEELSKLDMNFSSTINAFSLMRNVMDWVFNNLGSIYEVIYELWNGADFEWSMLLAIPKTILGCLAFVICYVVTYVWIMVNLLWDIITSAMSLISIFANLTGGLFLPIPDFVTAP